MNNFLYRRQLHLNGQLLKEGKDFTFFSGQIHFTFKIEGSDTVILHTYILGLLVGVSHPTELHFRA